MRRIVFALAACLTAMAASMANGAPIATTGGQLVGVTTNGVEVFRGIPFAAPPVDALRWQPPAPPQPWSGVRTADQFGAACPQDQERRAGNMPALKLSEDCLWLALWKPVKASKLPVLVWFFGGGFVAGDSSSPLNNGAEMAKRGVIVVAANYRFGALGYMAHPSLSAHSVDHISGNYGLLDQIAALKWVKANIAAFGGDPNRVTIGGQSSGGISVNALMASPLAAGLFSRAIVQSGPITGLTPPVPTLAQAEAFGAAFTTVRGANTLKELTKLTPAQLTTFWPPEQILQSPFPPLIDGHVLPNHPLRLFAAGSEARVPLLIGSTAHEAARITPMNPTPEEFEAWVRRAYPDQASAILASYDYRDPAKTRAAWLAVKSDDMFSGSRREVRFHVRNGNTAYMYRFDREPPGPDQERMRAFHGADMPYVFGTLAAQDRPWTEGDRALSQSMMRYWANFIATGNPNGAGLPEWTAYDPVNEREMALDVQSHMIPIPDIPRLTIYETPVIH